MIDMYDFSQRSGFGLERLIPSAICVAAAGLLFAGCAPSQGGGGRFAAGEGFPRAEAPSILTGPISVLLTNAAGISAHVTLMQNLTTRTKVPALAGDLVAQQGHLFWTPAGPDSRSRKATDHNFSYIWDVNRNSGYVLSEALQGYAPMNSSLRYTNLLITPEPDGSPAEKLEGHRCAAEQVTVLSSDGAAHKFRAWRAADLNGFPLKIVPADGDTGSTVLLSQVRPERTPADAFEPPKGFTRYESADAMMNEIMLRQRDIRRPIESGNFVPGTINPPGRRQGYSPPSPPNE
jgi:hypothetical protein